MQQEDDIEERLERKVKRIGGLCYKWVSPGNSGVPDRIVIYKSRVWFVETKAPGKKPRPLQGYVIKKINQQGACALALDTKSKVDKFIEKLEAM